MLKKIEQKLHVGKEAKMKMETIIWCVTIQTQFEVRMKIALHPKKEKFLRETH